MASPRPAPARGNSSRAYRRKVTFRSSYALVACAALGMPDFFPVHRFILFRTHQFDFILFSLADAVKLPLDLSQLLFHLPWPISGVFRFRCFLSWSSRSPPRLAMDLGARRTLPRCRLFRSGRNSPGLRRFPYRLCLGFPARLRRRLRRLRCNLVLVPYPQISVETVECGAVTSPPS
jgi:hypothetical protein